MIGQLLIHEFAPLWLSIDRIGPFQEQLEQIDFTDANDEPCNLYLFLSKNGRGKTTSLELMAALMGMLGFESAAKMARSRSQHDRTPFGLEDLDKGLGRAQWDLRVRHSIDGVERVTVLSLIGGALGADTSLKFWDSESLAKVGAAEWRRFGFCRNEVGRWTEIGERDEWVLNFNTLLAAASGSQVGGFQDSLLVWPTLIYFSAYRNVVPILDTEERAIAAPRDWNYHPVHAFRTEGGRWRDSLDNLLVWLKWLDDGRFERAIEQVNKRVFEGTGSFLKGISKEPPEAIIVREGNRHRLDALSSGEKSLIQLVLRLGAHMTRNTILLIDEPEAHLHDKWKYRLYYQIKALAEELFPGLTVIVATHSPEIITAFGIELEERNLRKGGYFFENHDEIAEAEQIKEEAHRLYGNLQD